MTRAQGDTTARERRQQDAEREAAMEAKQSGAFQPRPQRAGSNRAGRGYC